MRAVILAGGLGRRLGDLGGRTPKALVSLAGRSALAHLLEGLGATGVDHATIVVGHLGDQVRDALGRRAGRITLTYTRQGEPRGTAHALLCAREEVGAEPFLLSFGDIVVTPGTCRRLVHTGSGSLTAGGDGAILATDRGDPSRGAAVLADHAGIVQILDEKPPSGRWPGALNSAGMYVLGPGVWAAVAAVTLSSRGELELTSALAAHIAAGARYTAVATEGTWFDLADTAAVRAADAVLRRGA